MDDVTALGRRARAASRSLGLASTAAKDAALHAAAGLCIKSGNVAFLRGSSAALSSNVAIAAAIREGVAKAGLPEDSLVVVEDTSHEAAVAFMRLRDCIDCLIPRGGPSLIKSVLE